MNEKKESTMKANLNEVEINGEVYVKKGAARAAVRKDFCIVRGEASGVFAGNLVRREGRDGTIENMRRIWYWSGAASISQLAVEGVKNPDKCKFAMEVPTMDITDIIEVIPCTQEAFDNIKAVPVWKA